MRVFTALRITCLSAVMSAVIACSTSTDPAEAYPNESAHQIFSSGETALRDHNNGEAIKRFEALEVQYPYGQETELAQVQIIYAYYMSSEYASAEAAADRFIQAHPVSPHVDYAFFMRGVANYDQNIGVFERVFSVDLATRDLAQFKKAFSDFSEVVDHYPNSKYGAASHQFLVYLRNMMANHQLEVAQYYFSKEAYVAAINRANTVVLGYQGAPAVPQALVLMAKSYHQLNNKALEKQTIALLEYNFPHSKFVEDALSDEAKPATAVTPPSQKLVTDHQAAILPPAMPVAKPETQAALAPGQIERNGQVMASAQERMSNGSRSRTTTSLQSLMDTASDSGLFAFHSKKSDSKDQPAEAAPQPQVAAAKQPVETNGQVMASTQERMSNGSRSSTTSSLQSLMDKVENSSLFSFRSKKPASKDQPAVAEQQPVQVASAQNVSDEDDKPTVDDVHPYRDNGLR